MTCCELHGHDCRQGRLCPARHARAVQDFDSLPQYRAARAEQARRNADTYARWLRTWGRGLLWALAATALALLASHVAPIAAAHFADPLAGNPY